MRTAVPRFRLRRVHRRQGFARSLEFVARTFVACLLPALVICASWLRIEDPRRVVEALAVAGIALAAVAVPAGWSRAAASLGASGVVLGIAFGSQPWELLPFRDERVLAPMGAAARRGIIDFYDVVLPFETDRHPEMQGLVLVAVFGFTLAMGLLVAARRPLGAAAVTVAGAAWPTTLVGGQALAIGAATLAAALSIPLVLRARSGRSLFVGAAAAAIVVSGATWVSSVTTIAREAAFNWEAWDIGGAPTRATSVRFVWDSNYDGIRFPPTPTVVLTVAGPERAQYWRASTLDLFTQDRWFEDLLWLEGADGKSGRVKLDRLTPAAAARRENWLEQRIEVKALVDDRLVAAGTPVALDGRRLGTVFQLTGGVLRVQDPLGDGQTYRVWSYAPDPAPAALAASQPRYPDTARRYLRVDGRSFPTFGTPGRESMVRALFADPSYEPFAVYEPMYATARRVATSARTPYAAVLALESWLRQRGDFVYDEQPPRADGPPLVAFVTQTKAGYCQQYAGAMALMLRMLGIPARVAVGFTSGTFTDGKWVVTDRNAHAWVEVWFAGLGWIPFDPTPGRGTIAGAYSFASDSKEAVAALSRGDLGRAERVRDRRIPDSADFPTTRDAATDGAPSLVGIVVLLGLGWALLVGVGKAGLRRSWYFTRDPRQTATASRRELEAFLRDQGVAISPSATLRSLQRAVRDELGLDARLFTAAAAQARFAPPPDAEAGARVVRRELRALLGRARSELSVRARLRGFVSLRSLRGDRRKMDTQA